MSAGPGRRGFDNGFARTGGRGVHHLFGKYRLSGVTLWRPMRRSVGGRASRPRASYRARLLLRWRGIHMRRLVLLLCHAVYLSVSSNSVSSIVWKVSHMSRWHGALIPRPTRVVARIAGTESKRSSMSCALCPLDGLPPAAVTEGCLPSCDTLRQRYVSSQRSMRSSRSRVWSRSLNPCPSRG